MPPVETEHTPVSSIVDYVDSKRDALAGLLSDLVAIPTVFPSGEYEEIVARLETEFSVAGLRTTRITAPKERLDELGLNYPRPNLVAQFGSGRSPVLLIGAHMDVVEAGELGAWTHPPFEGAISDDRVWGRGSCDAKSALAAQVYAVRALVETGCTLGGTLLLAASVDDEGGYDGLNWPGMAFLAEEGLAAGGLPEPDMVINGEASGLDRICGSFKGRLILEIEILGETAHASTPHGTNAIDHALLLVDRLKRLTLEEHPLQGQETLTLCYINGGGSRYGDVPDSCRVGIDIRVVPPHSTATVYDDVRAVVDELVNDNTSVHVGEIRCLSERDPTEIPRNHALVQALQVAAQQVRIRAEYDSILGSGDLQGFLERGAAGVTYGPGSIARVHRANEFVEIDSLVQQTQIYALAALALCQGAVPPR
jgi:succinyl-diaminopimelate desuccinylase